MIEISGRFKGGISMATLAWSRQCFLMIILMAGQTVGIQAKVSEFFAFYLAVTDKVRLMAIFANFLCMGS